MREKRLFPSSRCMLQAVVAVGGALLMQGIRGLFGDSGSAHAKAFDPGLSGGQQSPWSGGTLANDAGVNDIGRTASLNDGAAGVFSGADDNDADSDFDDDSAFDGDDSDIGDP